MDKIQPHTPIVIPSLGDLRPSDSFYVPSDQERDTLTTALEEARGELKSLDALVSRLRQQLMFLAEEIIRPCTAAVSYVRGLSVEILQEIFALYLPLPPSPVYVEFLIDDWWREWYSYSRSHRVDSLNLNLMLVCRRWKTIVESSPHLWSYFHFRGDMSAWSAHKRSKSFQSKMQLCPTSPLRFDYTMMAPICIGTKPTDEPEVESFLLDFIQSTYQRWDSINIYLSHFTRYASSKLFQPRARFSLLRRISIYIKPEPMWFGFAIIFDQDNAPSLVDVQYNYSQNVSMEFPWAQLTRLAIRNLPERKLPTIVNQTNNIKVLILINLCNPVSLFGRFSWSYQCAGTLHTLILDRDWDAGSYLIDSLDLTLRRMTAPSLQSLKLNLICDASLSLLLRFFAISGSGLAYLAISFEACNSYPRRGRQLIAALQCLGSLQALVLGGDYNMRAIVNPLLRELQFQDSSGFHLLPSLTAVAFIECLIPSSPLFIETMKIRMGHDSQSKRNHYLSRITVGNYGPWEIEDGLTVYYRESQGYIRDVISILKTLCGPGQVIDTTWESALKFWKVDSEIEWPTTWYPPN